MAIGDLIFQLAGQKNPRDELLAALAGGGAQATPAMGAGTPGGGGTDPATAAPAQPQAYQSPPELIDLYSQLLKRQDANAQIDRGVGLIGASLAQEQNRPGILAAFGADGSGTQATDPASAINNIMKLREGQVSMAQQAAQRAALPSIAERYGLDLATAQYLFDTGKLDAVIAEAEKPNNEIVKNDDGTINIVDKTSGTIGETLGVPKKREIELVDDPVSGGKIAVYKDDKSRVGQGDIPGLGATADQKDYNFYVQQSQARGVPADKIMDLNTWQLQQKEKAADKTTIQTGDTGNLAKELEKVGSERYDTEYEAATGARNILDYTTTARDKLDQGIIGGSILSPVELEGRKAWADIMGLEDAATENTEAFKASLKEAVLSKIKALGSGTAISDADRKFIEQAVGGDISLTEGGMRQIFDILDKGARSKIEKYNRELDELLESFEEDDPNRARVKRMLRRVELPEVGSGDDVPIDDLLKKYGSR
jgi:hypothetical protein